jgi:hypothetical protein
MALAPPPNWRRRCAKTIVRKDSGFRILSLADVRGGNSVLGMTVNIQLFIKSIGPCRCVEAEKRESAYRHP